MASSTIPTDHYATLGIAKTASQQEVSAAYRRLALIHHPDKNPNDTEAATATFQRILLAYEVVSDPSRRQEYDKSRAPSSQYPYPAPSAQQQAESKARQTAPHLEEEFDKQAARWNKLKVTTTEDQQKTCWHTTPCLEARRHLEPCLFSFADKRKQAEEEAKRVVKPKVLSQGDQTKTSNYGKSVAAESDANRLKAINPRPS
ncbi:DnaJ domain-containing protein [Xylariomycetidae sp. FL2044]|nr:DnaJ domain-containing protein [Xylariomycetidae sp. FL2044]